MKEPKPSIVGVPNAIKVQEVAGPSSFYTIRCKPKRGILLIHLHELMQPLRIRKIINGNVLRIFSQIAERSKRNCVLEILALFLKHLTKWNLPANLLSNEAC